MHVADVFLNLPTGDPKALRQGGQSIEGNARMRKILDSEVTKKLRKNSRICTLILGSSALLWFSVASHSKAKSCELSMSARSVSAR
jgi:hypothetical protein